MYQYYVNTVELRKAMAEAYIHTGTELAKLSGVSKYTIRGVINGSVRPSTEVIQKMAGALELTSEQCGRVFFSRKLADNGGSDGRDSATMERKEG